MIRKTGTLNICLGRYSNKPQCLKLLSNAKEHEELGLEQLRLNQGLCMVYYTFFREAIEKHVSLGYIQKSGGKHVSAAGRTGWKWQTYYEHTLPWNFAPIVCSV